MGPATVIPLDDALAEVTTLELDTSPIIYLIETHPEYDVLDYRDFSPDLPRLLP